MLIHLISGPRNISTAMMYSFAQRPNCQVIDEPLYGCYLKETGIDHPGKYETMNSMNCNRKEVYRDVFVDPVDGESFLKNMGHHILKEDFNRISELNNFFLIRHPKRMIASYSKVISDFTLDDLGLGIQQELAQFLIEKGKKPVVFDSSEFLKNPEEYLQALCNALEIPFYDSMLHWSSGPRPEDGVWAKYWYANVHSSSGFKKTIEEDVVIDSRYSDLLNAALIPYSYLKQFEISI